jgi:adenosylhomocysteine nucleosidase
MKKIGIIFAMKEELDALLDIVNVEKEYKIFELDFYECTIGNTNCVLCESGVGKVNAARCTQILIDNMQVDYIINVGVAGGLNENLSVCDIVIGNKLVQHDFDITAFDHEKGYIPNVGKFIDGDEYLIKIANEVARENKYTIHNGVIASGDIFCTDKNMATKIKNKFDAYCVEMEGSSIAQVCYLCHIPFLVLRAISDIPNGDNVITYEEFLEQSSKNVAKFISEIIYKL